MIEAIELCSRVQNWQRRKEVEIATRITALPRKDIWILDINLFQIYFIYLSKGQERKKRLIIKMDNQQESISEDITGDLAAAMRKSWSESQDNPLLLNFNNSPIGTPTDRYSPEPATMMEGNAMNLSSLARGSTQQQQRLYGSSQTRENLINSSRIISCSNIIILWDRRRESLFQISLTI